MAINFTSNINEFTTANRSARVSNFREFGSKKKLEEAGILPQDQLDFVKQIRGTFTFALHTEGRYMVITLYHANAEKKYQFIVVDLQEKLIAECDSVKNAKAEVMELVAQATATTAEAVQEAPVEEAPAAENAEVSAKGRKSKKNDK